MGGHGLSNLRSRLARTAGCKVRPSDEEIGRAARRLRLLSHLSDEEVADCLNAVRPDLYELAYNAAKARKSARWRRLVLLVLVVAFAAAVGTAWFWGRTLNLW